MVAKISSNSSLFSTLLYNKNKIDKGEAALLSSRNVYERADGLFAMQTTIKSFEPYLIANRKTENPIFHVSINPSPQDKLTDNEYKEIADRYMEDMGYGNQPYVVFKHMDIDRTHLHVVSIRVNEIGKKIDSNFENIRSMKICRQIEKNYNLHPATKQEQQSYTIPTKLLNYKEGDIKRQIGNIGKAILNNYNFQSIGEYNVLLEKMNIKAEEVKGTKNNIPYHGLVYSALDDDKKKIGIPFKSSLFGKDINLRALDKHFEKSKLKIQHDKVKEHLRPIITKVMQQSQSTDEFKLLLKEKNIEPIFRQNEQGRIYGVTFIDHQNKCVLNGSRLGKEFSANVFNDLLNTPSERNIQQTVVDKPSIGTNRSGQPAESSEVQRSTADDSLSISPRPFEQHGDDWENENFVREKENEEKIRQKKKKRRGLGM